MVVLPKQSCKSCPSSFSPSLLLAHLLRSCPIYDLQQLQCNTIITNVKNSWEKCLKWKKKLITFILKCFKRLIKKKKNLTVTLRMIATVQAFSFHTIMYYHIWPIFILGDSTATLHFVKIPVGPPIMVCVQRKGRKAACGTLTTATNVVFWKMLCRYFLLDMFPSMFSDPQSLTHTYTHSLSLSLFVSFIHFQYPYPRMEGDAYADEKTGRQQLEVSVCMISDDGVCVCVCGGGVVS